MGQVPPPPIVSWYPPAAQDDVFSGIRVSWNSRFLEFVGFHVCFFVILEAQGHTLKLKIATPKSVGALGTTFVASAELRNAF